MFSCRRHDLIVDPVTPRRTLATVIKLGTVLFVVSKQRKRKRQREREGEREREERREREREREREIEIE